jgi:predicted ATPase/class 3 adenylate cyclase
MIDAVESSILAQDPALEAEVGWSDAESDELPSGVVTLLFTDIEGSAPLWEEDPERMQPALDRHDQIVREEVTEAGGAVVKSEGDSFLAAFASATRTVTCAIAIQRRLGLEEWDTSRPIAARIGIHSGDLEPRHGDYFGPAVNLAARVMQAGHGGQILVSGATANLTRPQPRADFSFRLLGRFELRGILDLVELHQLVAEGVDERFPPLMVVRADLPLPSPASAFVGRSAEIDELREAVRSNRLVTIVGEGGLGKTRLAIEVARRLTVDISSIGFADLAPRAGGSAVVDEVCRSVGLAEISGDPVEALRMRLGNEPALLVFDNCEHVVDAIRELTVVLLETCPGLRVLATSRQPLGISGERRYPLQPMAIEGDASALLNLRAEESGHTEPIPPQQVSALCKSLDGIPLAIELAASWLRILEPSDLLARLEQDVLMMDASQSRAHSKTMAQTIEWSLGRLAETESAAFDAISEFPAGISVDQAERLLGPNVLVTLGRLIDASLLRTTHAESGRRYRLLEPLRAIGLARVTSQGNSDASRQAQAKVMLSLASAVGASLPTVDEPAWRNRLEDEVPNLVAAMSWAVTADPSMAVEIVLPLAPLVSFVPASAARLAIPVAENTDWRELPDGLAAAALGLFAKAYLDADPSAATLANEIDEEIDRLDRAVDPSVLIHLATVRTVMNDPFGAIVLYREASERGREVGEQVTVAEALMLEGAWEWFTQSDMNEAGVRECSQIAAQLGGPSLISLCEVVNGFSTIDENPDRAEAHFRQALAVNAPTGYGPGVAEFMLGLLHARRGQSPEALTLAKAALRRFILAGLQVEVGMALGGLTGALLALGYEEPARFTAEVLARHFPPIASMRSFGQHIERAQETTTGVVDIPVRRDEAITRTLAMIDGLLAQLDSD